MLITVLTQIFVLQVGSIEQTFSTCYCWTLVCTLLSLQLVTRLSAATDI